MIFLTSKQIYRTVTQIFKKLMMFFLVFYMYTWLCAHSLHQKWVKEPKIRHSSAIMKDNQGGNDLEEVKGITLVEETGIENPLAFSFVERRS